MPVYGLEASYAHAENGMSRDDMVACRVVANTLNEVIIFRSTGPWSLRWLEQEAGEDPYPTKNFHVKGKSSDWGPQAGFVPYLGKYSKVGHDAAKAKNGTDANDDGLKHLFAGTTQLELSMRELNKQLTLPAGTPKRKAMVAMFLIGGGPDYHLYAKRPLDGQMFAFRAVKQPTTDKYKIFVYDNFDNLSVRPKELLVMTSSEVHAHNRPMTGDYDLMAVCPTWEVYGSRSDSEITKAGVNFGRHGGTAEAGQTFERGSNMDAVLDMRTNTGLRGTLTKEGKQRTYGSNGFTAGGYGAAVKARPGMSSEHSDMGNITPRILRCINYLNTQMQKDGPFRRVHHNAESHRNAIFGGITGPEMIKGEAFPLTIFQPDRLSVPNGASAGEGVSIYKDVSTLETMDEFKRYAVLLHKAGYYVPRSWTWGMSIREQIAGKEAEMRSGASKRAAPWLA